jgi:cysteine-rich repeat protein
MKRLASVVSLACLIVSSCSDPECLPGEEKVGNECRLVRDAPLPGVGADTKSCGSVDASTAGVERDSSRETLPASDRQGADAASEQVTDAEVMDQSTPSHAAIDTDSGPVCGNGKVEVGEDCDGNCPKECPDDNDPCTKPVVVGAACHRTCGIAQITERDGSDSCCVAGERAEDDLACTCGNQRFEPPEECDDYNTDYGDGCTPDCKLEDLSGTPGDDRIALSCGSTSCKKGEQCIVKQNDFAPYTCVYRGARAEQDTEYAECDGPEDCFPSQTCAAMPNDPPQPSRNYWMRCEHNSELRRLGRATWAISCHTDADCPFTEKCVPNKRFKGYGVCAPPET